MKNFLSNGVEITEQQAQEIERRNQNRLNSDNLQQLLKARFIYRENENSPEQWRKIVEQSARWVVENYDETPQGVAEHRKGD